MEKERDTCWALWEDDKVLPGRSYPTRLCSAVDLGPGRRSGLLCLSLQQELMGNDGFSLCISLKPFLLAPRPPALQKLCMDPGRQIFHQPTLQQGK